MFQTYEAPETRQNGTGRIDALRREMAKARLDALLVPRSDEHQGEYVAPSAERLTRREAEIVGLIDEGLSNKQIAGRLSIELATVKNHVHSILEKLQVERRAEAAARVRGTQD